DDRGRRLGPLLEALDRCRAAVDQEAEVLLVQTVGVAAGIRADDHRHEHVADRDLLARELRPGSRGVLRRARPAGWRQEQEDAEEGEDPLKHSRYSMCKCPALHGMMDRQGASPWRTGSTSATFRSSAATAILIRPSPASAGGRAGTSIPTSAR